VSWYLSEVIKHPGIFPGDCGPEKSTVLVTPPALSSAKTPTKGDDTRMNRPSDREYAKLHLPLQDLVRGDHKLVQEIGTRLWVMGVETLIREEVGEVVGPHPAEDTGFRYIHVLSTTWRPQ